jgi:hypothetical protein
MKMWSPHTIGVDIPLPGSFTFHLIPSVSLHLAGGCAVAETPVFKGPRHCGQ